MRIAKLVFKDVGPFDDAVFEFPEPEGRGELVLFEGPNGSGKTTIVEAIAAIAGRMLELNITKPPFMLLSRRYQGVSSSVEGFISWQSQMLHFRRRHGQSGFESVQDQGVVEYPHWRLSPSSNRSSDKLPWAAFAFGGHQETAGLQTEGPRKIVTSPLEGALSFGRTDKSSSLTGPASLYLGQLLTNLENERTKALAYAQERSSGNNGGELQRVAASRHEGIRRFEQVFSDVLGRRVTIEFSIDQQAPRIRFDGQEIPLDLLGEGMRSTFSWLSNLLVRLERIPWQDGSRSPLDQDFWLILDETDESLHPTMQARILPALQRLFPSARIYATTHSPFVVASLGEGTVFSIRPDNDHRVRGKVMSRRLEPGQSLELVTSEIFNAPSEFVDEDTRQRLAAHDKDIRALEERRDIDWEAFASRRSALMGRNDEVRTAVAMQELPVRQTIQHHLREREGGSSS